MTRSCNQRVSEKFGKSRIALELQNSQCAGKETFDHPQIASRVARKRKYPAEHYRCNVCGKYHIAGRTGK